MRDGGFSPGTSAAAVKRGTAPITLINREKLIDLLIKHKVGVRAHLVEILELDADAFAQRDEEDTAGITAGIPWDTVERIR